MILNHFQGNHVEKTWKLEVERTSKFDEIRDVNQTTLMNPLVKWWTDWVNVYKN